MRTAKRVAPRLLAAVLVGGCGDASQASPDESLPTTDEIAAYQRLVAKVQDGASAYRSEMMELHTGTVGDCLSVHEKYDVEVHSWVSRLTQLAQGMDRFTSDHGDAAAADHVCVSGAMTDELDRHHSAVCTSAHHDANQVEVERHVETMLEYGGHIWDRCERMMLGSGSARWGWGPRMDGCSDRDEQCTGMPEHHCGSGRMGGMHGRACCDR